MKKTIVFILIFFLPAKAVFQVISQPGLYKFGEDVIYSPAGPNDIVFQITSSNVTLDLDNYIIAQDGANVQTGLIGIQVASGLSNVTIKGGSVQNMRGTGVQVLSNCSRITLDNITTFSCETRGIDFVGTAGNTITDSIVRNCSVIQCCQSNTATLGFNMIFCSRFFVENLYAGNNGVTTHNLIVINLDNCNNCFFKRALVENSFGNTLLRGMLLVTSTNCVMTDCQVDGGLTPGNNGNCRGFEVAITSTNNIFLGCGVSRLTAATGAVPIISGFLILGSDNVFSNCFVQGMNGAIIHGFSLGVPTRVTLVDCLSTNNVASGQLVSFRSFATLVAYIRCKSIFNQSTASEAVGFDLNNGNEMVLQKCLVSNSFGLNDNSSVYFRQAGTTNTTAIQNVAARNTNTARLFTGFAGGSINISAPGAVNSTLLGPWTNLGIS